ncbi:MAG: putative KAP-like P-loop ATPase, partial [Phenylobacterium sp.]
MHSDHPTLNDRLERQPLIETKALQIINCTAPQTFGIHGDWGSGKTSFLRQLRYHLDGMDEGCHGSCNNSLTKGEYKKQLVTIWFDAWRYQHEAAPIVALLHEIRRQFGVGDKLKQSARKIGEVAVRSILNSFEGITKALGAETIPLGAKSIQKEGEKWEKQNLELRLGVDTIQEFLQSAIKALIGDKKLVVFIDDLDRCNSAAA